MKQEAYRGKHYTLPEFSGSGSRYTPWFHPPKQGIDWGHRIMKSLNQPFDLQEFKRARRPISLGTISEYDSHILSSHESGLVAPRTLDVPIKFPGSDFRLPEELKAYAGLVKMVADYEIAINPTCYDEYYCYLTIDPGIVKPGTLQREAPCHVDGFQGARWNPKVRNNHTYTVSNVFPTAYYIQPFDFDLLDDSEHDFFWEMNRQVAATNEAHKWQPKNNEMTLMDCYCVHRGVEADYEAVRTFFRMSFEVRIFDRLGNAHNPMFRYDWPMVPRDIEALSLTAFDPFCDPSLRVFPWQDLDGKEREPGVPKTKPNLNPKFRGNVTAGNVILKAIDGEPDVYPIWSASDDYPGFVDEKHEG